MVNSMDRWIGKVAVVTGASAGIGAAIAEGLVRAGLQVVGLARREEKLLELAKKLDKTKGTFHPLKADITDESDILAAFKWVKDNLGPVHILVNNAGMTKETTLTEGTTEYFKNLFDTNVLGLIVATREAVKDMKANNVAGHIIHINSTAGHVVVNAPNLNAYPATKFTVTALAETLRNELALTGTKIKVTSMSPGWVQTEIFEKSGLSPEALKSRTPSTILSPEDIADAVLYVLGTPPHVLVEEIIITPLRQ